MNSITKYFNLLVHLYTIQLQTYSFTIKDGVKHFLLISFSFFKKLFH